MSTQTASSAESRQVVIDIIQGPCWARALHAGLEWVCWLLRHPGACYLLNDWRVGQWIVGKSLGTH